MLIIVNTAFDEQHKQSDDENNITHENELVLISVNTSVNSCEANESTIDIEDLDTSDNNTTNNTQTTAECDDKLLLHINEKPLKNESSSGNEDDNESKENFDMNLDDFEDNIDELKRKHNNHDEYDVRDIQNIDETQKLVSDVDFDDCEYYTHNGDDTRKHELHLKINRGDGIIANHFIGLYHIFHPENKNLFMFLIENRLSIHRNSIFIFYLFIFCVDFNSIETINVVFVSL